MIARNIVIVCTANMTRSPYFEHRLRLELAKLAPDNDFQIRSAGTHDFGGLPADHDITEYAFRRGMDLTEHIANAFGPEHLDADLVLCMERAHRDQLLKRHGELAGRLFTLLAYGHEGQDDSDISDPTGGSQDEYELFLHIADEEATRIARLLTE